MSELRTPEELEARLREIGAERYHDNHPFHKLLHGGQLGKGQVQAWALNRYCYQCAIPIKDATLMSRLRDADVRRIWRQRVIDHDGDKPGEGGTVRWLALTDGLLLLRRARVSLDVIKREFRIARRLGQARQSMRALPPGALPPRAETYFFSSAQA